ncbi:MAG: hypothetical protein FWF67_04910 [Fibromonadales bacterium]|nr:hypothetical protein [Fibromonadales bacterium]
MPFLGYKNELKANSYGGLKLHRADTIRKSGIWLGKFDELTLNKLSAQKSAEMPSRHLIGTSKKNA